MPQPNINRMFRAFSDTIRLRILRLLRGGELCVGDLVAILRVSQPMASRHLTYLRKSGLVKPRKEGLWIYYSLSPARSSFHRRLLECLECCFSEIPELAADAIKAKKLRRSGGCCPK